MVRRRSTSIWATVLADAAVKGISESGGKDDDDDDDDDVEDKAASSPSICIASAAKCEGSKPLQMLVAAAAVPSVAVARGGGGEAPRCLAFTNKSCSYNDKDAIA